MTCAVLGFMTSRQIPYDPKRLRQHKLIEHRKPIGHSELVQFVGRDKLLVFERIIDVIVEWHELVHRGIRLFGPVQFVVGAADRRHRRISAGRQRQQRHHAQSVGLRLRVRAFLVEHDFRIML